MTITQSGLHLNASPFVNHLNAPFGVQHFLYVPSFGILSTYSPTFSAALRDALSAKGADVVVAGALSELRPLDLVILQLDSDVVGLGHAMSELEMPSIVVLHVLPEELTPQQHSAFEEVLSIADHVVVVSEDARRQLTADYAVDAAKVTAIAQGDSPDWPEVAKAYIRLAQGLVARQPPAT